MAYKTPYRSDGVNIFRNDERVAYWTDKPPYYKCCEGYENYKMTLGRYAKKFAHENPKRFPSGKIGEVEPEKEEPVKEEPIEEQEEESTYSYGRNKESYRPSKEKFNKNEVEIFATAPEKSKSLGDLTPEYIQWFADTWPPERFKQKYRAHIRAKIEPVLTIYKEQVEPKEIK